jgi:hypothetical protein
MDHPTQASTKENAMNGKKSEIFRDNAETCADKAETAKDGPAGKRFKRMEAAWLALADQQDWLDGEQPPLGSHRAVNQAVVSQPGNANRT